MRKLNLPLVTLSEAEVEAAFAEVADGPTERPTPWDELTDKQIQEIAAYFYAQKLRPQSIEGSTAQIDGGRPIFNDGISAKGIPPCHSCHGPGGAGNEKFPRLAGQHADYLVKQLTVFQRTDERPEGSIMKTVAHDLTQENIIDVAAYLQALPYQKAP